MHIETYIEQFSLDDVIAIEEQDSQFLSLQHARNIIHNAYGDNIENRELFVFLVVECALISFQIAGSGPKWWEEFSQKIGDDRNILQGLGTTNTDWWYQFLVTSRYNKRLYNNKRKRLEKFIRQSYPVLMRKQKLLDYENTMEDFRRLLTEAMQQKISDKTMSFTVKMYGYAVRIATHTFVGYPMSICIPLDSRLRKIYSNHFPDIPIQMKQSSDIIKKLQRNIKSHLSI